ncbi:MAG: hypothetical protein IKP86_09855, partial [Anaerolineaceae bacterium]|nr:hypothetical protein [Anaerolineaceae bacterium]
VIKKDSYLSGHATISHFTAYYRLFRGSVSLLESLIRTNDYSYYLSTKSEISTSGAETTDSTMESALKERYPEITPAWVSLK